MHKYFSAPLRYVHDVVTAEFLNVGVVLFAPESGFLRAKFINSFTRLHGIFNGVDETHLAGMLQYLAECLVRDARIARDAASACGSVEFRSLLNAALPPDESSLQWGNISGGFTQYPAKALDDLFDRFCTRDTNRDKRNECVC